MLLFLAKIAIVECLVFFLMVIGAIALSHLGLMLVSCIDRSLSPQNRRREKTLP